MIDVFIAVQWHRVMDQNPEAREVLAKFQADILYHRIQQINPVVDYYREPGVFEEESGDYEEDEDNSDKWDPEWEVEKEGEERNHSEYLIIFCPST